MGWFDYRESDEGGCAVAELPPRMGVEIPGGISDLASQIVDAIKPQLAELTGAAAEAAQPVISRVVREDVIPGIAPYLILSLVGVGAVAALIGALLARGAKR